MSTDKTILWTVLSSCAFIATIAAVAIFAGNKKNPDKTTETTGDSTTQIPQNKKNNPVASPRSTGKIEYKTIDVARSSYIKKISKDDFESTLEKALPILKERPAYFKLEGKTVVIGDIHGNLDSLSRIKTLVSNYLDKDYNILFLGDSVDLHSNPDYMASEPYKGRDGSAECFAYIMDLISTHPDKVHMVIGNHETSFANCPWGVVGYAIPQWCKSNGADIEKYISCCEALPIACNLTMGDKSYFCVHGGICEDLNPDEYHKIKFIRTNTEFDEAIKTKEFQSLWNDATDRTDIVPYVTAKKTDSNRKFFGKEQTWQFLDKYGFDKIIRGHDFVAVPNVLHDGTVVTIMSDYYNPKNAEDPYNRRILEIDGTQTLKFIHY